MKTSFISNVSIQSSMRSTINQVQSEIVKAQKEVVTGKLANIGEELGGITGRALNLHRDFDRMHNIRDTNSVVNQRLSASQAAMTTMSQSAQAALESLIGLSGASEATQLAIAVQTMTNAMDGFIDAANSSVNGEYLFSGINTDVKPVNDYHGAGGSAAKATFDAAFLGFFGFSQTNPLAAGITPTAMDNFLTGTIEPMFSGAQWNTDWSNATDEKMSSRISRNEVVNSSTTANEPGMRNMALGAMVAIELVNSPITRQVRQHVVEKAVNYLGQAISGVDFERGQMGLSQARVKTANESIAVQLTIIETNLNDMEGINVYEASTKMTSLMTQIEISYNLTARISQLSLVNQL